MKHSYIRYAAIRDGDPIEGLGIFEFGNCEGEDGELERYHIEWCFDPEIIADCAYKDKDFLELDIKNTNCPAQIKKYKITVEELADCD